MDIEREGTNSHSTFSNGPHSSMNKNNPNQPIFSQPSLQEQEAMDQPIESHSQKSSKSFPNILSQSSNNQTPSNSHDKSNGADSREGKSHTAIIDVKKLLASLTNSQDRISSIAQHLLALDKPDLSNALAEWLLTCNQKAAEKDWSKILNLFYLANEMGNLYCANNDGSLELFSTFYPFIKKALQSITPNVNNRFAKKFLEILNHWLLSQIYTSEDYQSLEIAPLKRRIEATGSKIDLKAVEKEIKPYEKIKLGSLVTIAKNGEGDEPGETSKKKYDLLMAQVGTMAELQSLHFKTLLHIKIVNDYISKLNQYNDNE